MKNDFFPGVEVLIAEDNLMNYTLLREIVHFIGIEHFWAKNGVEVLDILAKHENISLILMDVNMPEMDGITATQKIRERKINIPIIFQSAYASDENIKGCFKAGGNEFLSKPLNEDEFYFILKKYLSNSYSQQS
jgi:CheY-like chemotaxis protein